MPHVPTTPELQVMTDEQLQAAHRFGRRHEKKVRRTIQDRRRTANLPPGFIPRPPLPPSTPPTEPTTTT